MIYNYNPQIHNYKDPQIIVPIIMNYFSPSSVIDIGCGTGNFLAEFKKFGVKDVLGVDGDIHSSSLRMDNLTEEQFLQQDLNKQFKINKKFDIALCLEVGEHVSKESSEDLVLSLINASDIIIFSAAIPLQGGQYHINEQWQSYWSAKFEKHKFKPIDLIRPLIWKNPEIKYWYKQNIIVYVSYDYTSTKLSTDTPITYVDIVHPDNYASQVNYLQQILSGKARFIFYCYLFLKWFKSFFEKNE
ncbi:MAG: methyltransferase domain-containing protein [Sediminibacterium sp.]|jgi:SAM-dependent methyltransferase|nr:methyltransferase domain-containing protein [Chitinophagaceae bacterium]MCA6446069.1 methyltransferase domain-containing protein [Chitinophagaceae bacterium]